MPAATLRLIRKIHLYFGLFIAPALLFFAFTGSMQTLSLHEAAGSSYHPPRWLLELGQLHKKQALAIPSGKPQPAGTKLAGPAAHHDLDSPAPRQPQPTVTLASKERQHLPMKIFFLAVALGLFTSTLTGIYMAYKYTRNKLLVTAVLLAGVLVPLVLLKF